jgi:hypothetical protein
MFCCLCRNIVSGPHPLPLVSVIEVRKLLEKGFPCLVCLYRKEGREGLKHRPGLILGIFLSLKSREKKDIEKRSNCIVDIC